ncbi:MAG TPA: response regulator transcription factor [Bdellovibrionota bacterium]|nr:response regulator transcription factor [Bdellovibrionota bacterium]
MVDDPNRSRPLVLVVEDDPDIAQLLKITLAKESLDVFWVDTGTDAFSAVQEKRPDVVLLDLMLPGQNGFQICTSIKESPATSHIPVLMISARNQEKDILEGYELGIDDYITKPFSPKVLVAKLRRILDRDKEDISRANQTIELGSLTLDPKSREARVDGEAMTLTKTEFDILFLLAVDRGKAFSRSEIVDAIRGKNFSVTERSIDFQIVGIRRKMGSAKALLETVRGIGYRLNPK